MNINDEIKYYSNRLMFYSSISQDLTLYFGKMGIAIYFSYCSKIMNNKTYEDFADALIDDIYEDISSISSLDFATGLTGIAWGMLYLIKNKFIEGNHDIILKDIDDKIIVDYFNKKISCIEAILPYLLYRIKSTSIENVYNVYTLILNLNKANRYVYNYSIGSIVKNNNCILNNQFDKIGLKDGCAGALFKLCYNSYNGNIYCKEL